MICMACFDEEEGDIFEDDFNENVIKDTTGSSFDEKMMSLTNCQVLANGSFQDWQSEQNVLEKITNIPCPKYLNDKSEQKCGIVTYVDFMDKCLDVNVSNNMQILPFKMNTSQCKENHDDNCNVYPDFYSEGKTKIFSLYGKKFSRNSKKFSRNSKKFSRNRIKFSRNSKKFRKIECDLL